MQYKSNSSTRPTLPVAHLLTVSRTRGCFRVYKKKKKRIYLFPDNITCTQIVIILAFIILFFFRILLLSLSSNLKTYRCNVQQQRLRGDLRGTGVRVLYGARFMQFNGVRVLYGAFCLLISRRNILFIV